MNKGWAFTTIKIIKSGCLLVATLTGVNLITAKVAVNQLNPLSIITSQPALAQPIRPNDVWQLVYQRLPNFPLENQYISKETGKVATNNNLVSRLIRYHTFVKGRPPNYRFDWKLTLADYLGANDRLVESVYPGYDTLQTNPMEGDRAAINRLNRAQREALVNTLVSIFNPDYQKLSTPSPNPTPTVSPQSTPKPQRRLTLPKPGDAQLLK